MLHYWHSYRKLQYEDFRVFRCKSENSVENSKEMYESNDDYEDTLAQKPYSDRPVKKRTPEFLCEIQAMIENIAHRNAG